MATQLQIPTPCHEQWSEMTPIRHDCRHCAACDRQIVDFTQKTDAEVLKFLSQNAGKICGRFRATQMERPLSGARAAKKGGFTAIAASFAAALAAQQPADKQTVDPLATEQTSLNIREIMGKPVKYDFLETDSMRTITGKVQDEFGNPLIGATVNFAKTRTGTFCDVEGNFRLAVAIDSLKNHPLEIQISYTGFATKIVELPMRILNEDLALLPAQTTMETNALELMGDIIIIRPGIKSRLRYFFHKLFH